jgi:predicted permease
VHSWRGFWVRIVGRLNTSEPGASSELTAVLRNAYSGSDAEVRSARLSVRPLSFNNQGAEPRELNVSRLLAGVAVIMLFLAAANIANLILARALRRTREIGVRLALGAGRWRLVRLLVVEAVFIGALAGAVGFTLARWGGAAIRATLLPEVAWAELPVSGRVFAWMLALTMVTGVVVGLLPALRISRLDLVDSLRSGGARTGQRDQGARVALQVVQLALCVILLFTAGLFTRSLWNVRQLDLGMEPDRVLTVSVAFPSEGAGWAAVEARRYRDLRERVHALPGVSDAALSVGLPLQAAMSVDLRVPGLDSVPQAKGGGPFIHAVSPSYFSTIGTRILRGRGFEERDVNDNDPVTVINETMASTIWPDLDPIGRCVFIGDGLVTRCSRIVGIAADANQWRLKEDAAMQYYIPLGQETNIHGTTLLVRPTGLATAFIVPLTRQLKALAPDAQFVSVARLQDRLDPEIRPWRVGAMLFGAFGGVAMVVAAIGLFSVVSYLVTQRTHEMGVRLALGARRSQVIRLVIRRALAVSLFGTAIGSALAFAAGPLVQPMLFDNPARDPWVLLGVAGVLAATAIVASVVPSWRASRINPMTALAAD